VIAIALVGECAAILRGRGGDTVAP
jgi:hypothetical protein